MKITAHLRSMRKVSKKGIVSFFLFVSLFNIPLVFAASDFHVKGALSQEFDDNIFYTEKSETSDAISRLSVGAEFVQEQKTQSLSASVNLHQNLYWDNSDINNFAQDFAIHFKKEFSKYSTITVGDVFTHAEDPYSFEDAFGQESGRFDRIQNRFSISNTRNFSSQYSLVSSYTNEVREYDRPNLADGLENEITLQLESVWSQKTTGYIKYDFTQNHVDTPDNAYFHTIAPGFRRNLTDQLVLDSFLGPTFIQTYNGENLVEPIFYVGLTDELDKRSQFKTYFIKSHEAGSSSVDIFDQWRLSAQYQQQILERLTGSISAFYGEGVFNLRDITDRLAGLGFGVGYELSRNLKTTMSYGYSSKTSSEDTRDYKKNLIQLGLTFNF